MRKALSIAATLAALTLPQASFAETTNLLVNCLWPPQHFMCQEVLKNWGEAVEKVTDGRVLVQFPASNLAPAGEQMASARSGIYDAAIQANNFIANEVVGPQVSMLPLVSDSSSLVNSVALWRTYEKYFKEADEYEGVHLLGLVVLPGSNLYSTNDTPITSLNTAADRKIWSPPGAIAEILKNEGAGVVSGPAIQMTELIQRGVVDGFVGLDVPSSAAFGVLPYAKSMTITAPSLFTASFSFVINEAKWESISAEDQKAIMGASGEAFATKFGEAWTAAGEKAMGNLSKDFIVIQADEKFNGELAGLAGPFVADWLKKAEAKGIDGAAALEFYGSTVQSLRNK